MRNSEQELTGSKQRLLHELVSRKIPDAPVDAVACGFRGARLPLCSAQSRIWFMERLIPGTPLYNHSMSLDLPSWPDSSTVRSALTTLMKTYDALCLRVFEVNGEPLQEADLEAAPPLTCHDLRAMDAQAAELSSRQISEQAVRAPFRLDRAPLFRVVLILLPDGTASIVCIFHHLVLDGWSAGLFCGKLVELITTGRLAALPPFGYLDYVSWQTSDRDSGSLIKKQLDHWRIKLGGDLPVLALPADRTRSAAPSHAGGLLNFDLSASAFRSLAAFAEAQRTSLFVVLLAAFKVLLLRLTEQVDVIVGVPFAGRVSSETEALLGSFVNMLALRTDLGGGPTFREVVRRVHETALDAYDNQAAPFERVVETLRISRDSRRQPVFQAQFALHNMPVSLPPEIRLHDVLDTATSKFDLTLSLKVEEAGASGLLEYSTALFDRPTAAGYLDMYLRLLRNLTNEPNLPVSRHGLLAPAERERILHELNSPVTVEITASTLAQPFEERAALSPDAIALCGEEGHLTYRELNERANRVAHLLGEHGVEPGAAVAVCMERSFAMVIALYAIAKAGAAYVPLDPELPLDRIVFMLSDTGSSLVLTHLPVHDRIPAGPWRLLTMEEAEQKCRGLPATNLACERPSHELAYLMYTSGSTGRPKAVAFPVNAAISSMLWLQRSYPLAPGDGHLFKTPFGFDVSIWELFWPLYVGATLVVCRPGGHRDPDYIVRLIERHRVSAINFVPSMLQAFLEQLPKGGCCTLRWILCGGEPMTPHLRKLCHGTLPTAVLVNLYGPTETHAVTDMIIEPASEESAVPLGRPSAGFRLYVLDEEFEPKPIGVPGELYIAGEVGLAHGYHGRPDLTAERFVPDPFGPAGGRMYRTGDLCRYLEGGVLEHLGRIDTQVKVHGMRIETAEIEACLCEDERVEAAVVLAADIGTGQQLLAFVVPRGGVHVEAGRLLEHARRFLPRYMVPSTVQCIEQVPTTVNGKVDKKALVSLCRPGEYAGREFVAPQGKIEERLKLIFEQVLSLPNVGVTENFFEIGGHSLLVFKLVAACEREFGHRPSVLDVFSAPSVRELGALLETTDATMELCLVPFARRPGKPAIVFIHGAGGSALPFLEVSRHLEKDYSVLALQAPGVDGDWPLLNSVAEYAARYVRLLDETRGHSPLILAGWSFGGAVAVEMTRNWRARGIEVAATLLLDSWLPNRLTDSEVQGGSIASIREVDFLQLEIGTTDFDPVATSFERLSRVMGANREALLRYEPDWFDGEIELLRASEPFPASIGNLPPSYGLPDRGWARVTRKLNIREVCGDHFTLIRQEHAVTLAGSIRAVIEARLSYSSV